MISLSWDSGSTAAPAMPVAHESSSCIQAMVQQMTSLAVGCVQCIPDMAGHQAWHAMAAGVS